MAGLPRPGEQRRLDRLEADYVEKCALFNSLLDDGYRPRLVVSSDAGPFDTEFGRMYYNMQLAVRGGMTPPQAVEAVTRVAAEARGIGAHGGTLEPGKRADMLVVRGDPLERR